MMMVEYVQGEGEVALRTERADAPFAMYIYIYYQKPHYYSMIVGFALIYAVHWFKNIAGNIMAAGGGESAVKNEA